MEWEERVWKEWRKNVWCADSKPQLEDWCAGNETLLEYLSVYVGSHERLELMLEWALVMERRDQHAWWFKLFWRHLKEGEEARRAVMMNPPPLPLQLPRSLQELHIAELPLSFENLCNLEILELDGSLSKMQPPSASDLRNLKELRLLDCPRWKCLPDSLGQLTVLEVARCRGLVEVGTLPSTLIQLSMISCPNLEKIDGLCGLAKLQTLNISGWRKVEELAGIETLVSLEQLRASGCEKLKRMHGLSQLTKLKLLDFHGCRELEELEGVELLRSLEMLDASDCPRLHWDSRVLEQLLQRLKEGAMLYI